MSKKNKSKKAEDNSKPTEFEDAGTAPEVTDHENVELQGEDLGKDQDQQANNQIPNQSLRDQAKIDAENGEDERVSSQANPAVDAAPVEENALTQAAADANGENSNGGIHDPSPSTQIQEPDRSTPNATSTRASAHNDPAPVATPADNNEETKDKKNGKKADCPNCNGSGLTDAFTLCSNCGGTGTIKK